MNIVNLACRLAEIRMATAIVAEHIAVGEIQNGALITQALADMRARTLEKINRVAAATVGSNLGGDPIFADFVGAPVSGELRDIIARGKQRTVALDVRMLSPQDGEEISQSNADAPARNNLIRDLQLAVAEERSGSRARGAWRDEKPKRWEARRAKRRGG